MSDGVIINMTRETTSALKDGGYWLYGFRAVRTDNQAARPVLWYATQTYSVRTQVLLPGGYQAYISSTPTNSGQKIFIGFNVAIEEGQCLQVDDTGIGDVVGGQEAFIAISNTGGTPFTAGLAQALSGTDKVVPFYAEPLYGHQTNFAQPTSKILLVLSTQVLAPGTVIDKLPLVSATMATAQIRTAQTIQGILIDTASERTVEFDINGGWKWNGGVWASLVSVNAGLIGALIEKLS